MADLWNTTADERKAKAVKFYTSLHPTAHPVYVKAHNLTTGLWADVEMYVGGGRVIVRISDGGNHQVLAR